MMKQAFAAFLATLALPAGAQAQSTGWEYSLSFHGWLSSLGSAVETPAGTLEIDLSFGDLLENLDFAAFAAFEARRGDWSGIADLNESGIGAVKDSPFGLSCSEATVDAKLTILAGHAARAVVNEAD